MYKLVVILLFGLVSARLSDEKCKEYHKESSTKKTSLIDEFPHMGLLGFTKDGKTGYHCPATLISESFVLTPAFCLTSTWGAPTHVLLRTSKENSKDEHSKLLEVVETIAHPDYNDNSASKAHSIALVKFSPPITISDHIKPGCLYTKSVDNNEKVTDLLWTRSGDKYLFKVETSIVPTSACKQKYKGKVDIDENSHLCVERKNLERHIGGTSHVYEDGLPKVAALDNFGPVTPKPDLPDVTTKVYNYLDWIESNVWKS